MIEKVTGNTGTRLVGTSIIGGELVNVIWDARWMLLAIFVCIVADFRYGWGESSKRHTEALKDGDVALAEKYRWRTSRALRRSVNKSIDYLVWIIVGMAIGMAVLPYFGVDYTWGGAAASTIAIGCEVASMWGHFMYLHGIVVKKKSINRFVKMFVVSLAKKKDEDIGEALEESLERTEEN